MKHLKQIAAYNDKARFKFINAGRRGGKTELIVEDISKAVSEMPFGSDIFYVGPTNLMALEIIWERLLERFDSNGWKYRDLISRQKIHFSGQRILYCIGAEKIRRIRGHKVYKAYLDELAFFETDLNKVWRAVRPTLTDLGGKAIISTTPDGKGSQAYDFYLASLEKHDWSYHHWATLENPGISRDEIEDARKELDPLSFKQEYEAEWVSFEGLAWYCFNENIHIKKQPPLTPDLPFIMHLDFNVNPTSLVLGQRDDKYRIKKEYSFKNSSTEATVKNFCEDFKEQSEHIRIKIRGDSTGNNRKSTTGYADYHYVKQMLQQYGFKYEYEVPAANPSIVDRVRHGNSYLMNTYGEHRLEFDPSCKESIRDFSSQTLEGRFPSDKNNLGHKSDAISYGIYWDYITTRPESKSSTIQL